MKGKCCKLAALVLAFTLLAGTTVWAKGNAAQQIINSVVPAPVTVASQPLADLMAQLFPQIITPDMTTYDQVKACYDWLIVNTEYGFGSLSPEDQDLIFETYSDSQSYMVVKDHIGDCIDYSVTFSKMLRTIGIDCHVQYGLTSKTDGSYTTHAWVVAVINGQEYIFDPQIEDNIAKGGPIRYYRFCKTYEELPGKYLTGDAAAQRAYEQGIYDPYVRWLSNVQEQENAPMVVTFELTGWGD